MPVNPSVSNIVVLGAWNPAIISPVWLSQYKVVDGPVGEAELGFDPNGAVNFKMGKFRWSIDTLKLTVSTDGFSNDGANFIARVLGLLPHTPVSAIGMNFIFTCSSDDLPPSKLPRFGDIQLAPTPTFSDLKSIQTACIRQLSDSRLQISVTQQEGKNIVISVNIHRDVINAGKATEIASAWTHDKDTALSVVNEMLGVKVP